MVGVQGSRLPAAIPASPACSGGSYVAGPGGTTVLEHWLVHEEKGQLSKRGQYGAAGLPT